jgi:methyl coenzyme M reductase subunit C-like uncharacterized protein (methanogenesis marker protein 7)
MRRSQLEARHKIALMNAAYRSQRWHRMQSARRYYRRFGAWPHEVKFYRQIGRLDFLVRPEAESRLLICHAVCVFIGTNFGEVPIAGAVR